MGYWDVFSRWPESWLPVPKVLLLATQNFGNPGFGAYKRFLSHISHILQQPTETTHKHIQNSWDNMWDFGIPEIIPQIAGGKTVAPASASSTELRGICGIFLGFVGYRRDRKESPSASGISQKYPRKSLESLLVPFPRVDRGRTNLD